MAKDKGLALTQKDYDKFIKNMAVHMVGRNYWKALSPRMQEQFKGMADIAFGFISRRIMPSVDSLIDENIRLKTELEKLNAS